MKRSIFIAALSTLAAGSALAQSNVAIYGRLSESLERQKVGSTHATRVVDNESRIGFKGSEDLGGGLKASFVIEHGFGADTGAAAGPNFWSRESTVGLSNQYGSLRLGNMGRTAAFFATADAISYFNHDAGSTKDAFYFSTGSSVNNIAYKSPTLSGMTGEVQFGLREGGTKNTTVLAGTYDQGALHLGASYAQGPSSYMTASFDNAKQYGLRGSYELGQFTAGAYLIVDEVDISASSTKKRNSLRLSGMWVDGMLEVHGNLGLALKTKTDGTTDADSSATQFTLGANYNLTKRTKAFAFVTKVSNKANADYATGVDGDDFQSFGIGLRHNF